MLFASESSANPANQMVINKKWTKRAVSNHVYTTRVISSGFDVYQRKYCNYHCYNLCAFLCLQLFTFPVLQQFGLLFKERLETIGLSATQIATIINLNPCVTSCSGERLLLNCYCNCDEIFSHGHILSLQFIITIQLNKQ